MNLNGEDGNLQVAWSTSSPSLLWKTWKFPGDPLALLSRLEACLEILVLISANESEASTTRQTDSARRGEQSLYLACYLKVPPTTGARSFPISPGNQTVLLERLPSQVILTCNKQPLIPTVNAGQVQAVTGLTK